MEQPTAERVLARMSSLGCLSETSETELVMFKVSAKGMWAHKRRLFGTVFAVVLGVAFLAGTLVLGDTMRAGIDTAFTEANAGIDGVVRSDTKVGTEETETRGLDRRVARRQVAQVDGVATVGPGRGSEGPDRRGRRRPDRWRTDRRPTPGTGSPTPTINPRHVIDGRAPEGPGEMVINETAADDGKLKVGDTTTVLTPAPVEAQIVGIVRLGDDDSTGGATFAGFTLAEAQRSSCPHPTKLSGIYVAADPGVSQEQLVGDVRSRAARRHRGDHRACVDAKRTSRRSTRASSTSSRRSCLVFAGIALLVGTFSIYNTFSILIAQRTRESALLRAIGASRAQVLRSITARSARHRVRRVDARSGGRRRSRRRPARADGRGRRGRPVGCARGAVRAR